MTSIRRDLCNVQITFDIKRNFNVMFKPKCILYDKMRGVVKSRSFLFLKTSKIHIQNVDIQVLTPLVSIASQLLRCAW